LKTDDNLLDISLIMDVQKRLKTSHLKTLRISACPVPITAPCQSRRLFDALKENCLAVACFVGSV
jgi:hypothetical protein